MNEIMTETEARKLVTEIKAGISGVGAKLLELHERNGWQSLGYSNWRDCVMTEFDFQQSHVYRLLDFARVERNLSPIGGKITLPTSERQARPLASLTPDQQREVWPLVLETAPNGKPTAAIVESVVKDFNYLRDSRRSQVSDIYTPLGMDACQTPDYAIDPLLPYLPEGLNIWEPAAGEGYLRGALYDSGFSVIHSDILTGQNFFEYQPEKWDAIVTNPPYSIHFQWLERCYQLGKPFALLLKVEILGTKKAQDLMEQYGFEILLLDKRVDFKMPRKGWESSATFPTFWLCWKLLPKQVMFGKLQKGSIFDDIPNGN